MIAASPRTGSTLLAVRLWQSGWLGAPLEYLNPLSIGNTDVFSSADAFASYWDETEQRRTSPNGVFGYKVFVTDLQRIGALGDAALGWLRADAVLFLRRRDILGQAISHYRAIAAGEWFADAPPSSELPYNFDAILAAMGNALEMEESWRRLFRSLGEVPIEVFYEDIAADTAPCIAALSERLGITRPAHIEPPRVPHLVQQSKAASAQWAERFHDDLAKKGLTIPQRAGIA